MSPERSELTEPIRAMTSVFAPSITAEPYRNASAPSSSITSISTAIPSDLETTRSSGRRPTVTDFSLVLPRTAESTLIVAFPNLTPPATILSVNRFIAGEPMKPATNTLAGRSYSARGVSTCCKTPSFKTATRSPMVIASTWSWVT